MELSGSGIDWYWLLQLFASASPSAIETQYRKIVTELNLIKNDFPGTDLALKFVGDAYSVLSDPIKREEFDSKRNIFQGMPMDATTPGCSGTKNPVCEVSGETEDVDEMQRRNSFGTETSWAMQQVNSLDNDNLQQAIDLSDPLKFIFPEVPLDSISPGCSGPKRADVEVCSDYGEIDEKQKRKNCDLDASWVMEQVNTTGNDNLQMASGVLEENLVTRKQPVKDFNDFESRRKAEIFSVGQIWAAYDQEHMPRRYGKIVMTVPQKLQFYVAWYKPCPGQYHDKKWQDASFPVACGTFNLELNKMSLCGSSMFSCMLSDGITSEPLEIYPKKGEVWAIYKDWDTDWCSNPEMRKNCAFEIVEILADWLKDCGAKVAHLVRVQGFNNVFQRYLSRGNELSHQIPSNKLPMFSHKIPAFGFMGGEICGIENGMLELDPLAIPDTLVQDFSCVIVVPVDSASQSNEERDCSDETSITNPINPSASTTDTDGSNTGMQNRKRKLAPKDFARDQVWAVYDGLDAMPRTYVKVNDVVSPSKLSVTFLEPHPMLDQEILWVEEDLPIVCGIFRAGRASSTMEMSKFSHLVQCDRSTKKSYYRIFPRKGEIWAIYRNWNINWKSSTLNEYECRIVEILSDFSEEDGVRVCSLVEVQGCLTFFQRQLQDGFQLTRKISRLELLSFSHRVPAFTVIGIKHPNIPKGSLHLEPDALPPKVVS